MKISTAGFIYATLRTYVFFLTTQSDGIEIYYQSKCQQLNGFLKNYFQMYFVPHVD